MDATIYHFKCGYSEWNVKNSLPLRVTNSCEITSPVFRCERNKQWCLVLKPSYFNLQVCLNLISKDRSPFDLSGSYIHFVDKQRWSRLESRIELERSEKYYVFDQINIEDFFEERNGGFHLRHDTLTLRFFIDAKIIINASYNNDLQDTNSESPKSCFEILFNNPELSDVQLIVGENKFFAHKAILANCSSVFAAMFRCGLKENDENVVKISDISAEAVGSLLKYMYTQKARINENIVFELLMASDKYLIDSLKKSCEKYLLDTLTIKNCLEYVLAADRYNMNQLKGESIVRIGRNDNVDFIYSKPFIELQKSNVKLYAEIGQHFMYLVTRSK